MTHTNQNAREMYESGMSLAEVGKALGVSLQTARNWIARDGGAIRPIGMTRNKSKVDLKEVARLYDSGLSMSEVGKAMQMDGEYLRVLLKKSGHPMRIGAARGHRNTWWRGGRLVDADGYILVYCPDHPHRSAHNKVREHRLVMEKKLGRFLDPKEVVHHIDGNRANNHPDNLAMFRSNADHLAETLKGKCPKWTEQGLSNIRARSRAKAKKESSSRPGS